MSRVLNDILPIYIVLLINIKTVVLSALVVGFSIKNSLVISFIIGITIPVDEEKIRSNTEGRETRPVDVEKTKSNTEKEGIRPVDIERSANAKS